MGYTKWPVQHLELEIMPRNADNVSGCALARSTMSCLFMGEARPALEYALREMLYAVRVN
jgi:hypothetical protein